MQLTRVLTVLVTFVLVFEGYWILAARAVTDGTSVAATALDGLVGPSLPLIAVYVLYYPFLLTVFCLYARKRDFFFVYGVTLLLVAACFLSFALYPTSIDRPSGLASGCTDALLSTIWQLDPAGNCVPSLHVGLTIWASHLSQRMGLINRPVAVLICTAMGFAALGTAQHLLVDVLAGAALGLTVVALHRAALASEARTLKDNELRSRNRPIQLAVIAAVLIPLANCITFLLCTWSQGIESSRDQEAHRRLARLTDYYATVPEIPGGSMELTAHQLAVVRQYNELCRDRKLIRSLMGSAPCSKPLSRPQYMLIHELVFLGVAHGRSSEEEQGWLLLAGLHGKVEEGEYTSRLEGLRVAIERLLLGAARSRDATRLRAQLDPLLEWIHEGGLIERTPLVSNGERPSCLLLPDDVIEDGHRNTDLPRALIVHDKSCRQGRSEHRWIASYVELVRLASFGRVVLAVADFRKRNHRWPQSLAEAFSDGQVELFDDPATGRPFEYTGGSLEMRVTALGSEGMWRRLVWPR